MARRTAHSLYVPSQFILSYILLSSSPGTFQSSLTSVQPKTEKFSHTESMMNPSAYVRNICLYRLWKIKRRVVTDLIVSRNDLRESDC